MVTAGMIVVYSRIGQGKKCMEIERAVDDLVEHNHILSCVAPRMQNRTTCDRSLTFVLTS
jgi:hypothetical protein